MNNDVIERLAAANPVPSGEALHLPEAIHVRPPRLAVAVALVAAIAIPAAAFAGQAQRPSRHLEQRNNRVCGRGPARRDEAG